MTKKNDATREPDADRIVALVRARLKCGACYGLGSVTEVAPVAGGLWAVIWHTEHMPNCSGAAFPGAAYLVDMAALMAGDTGLPGIAADWRERDPGGWDLS